MRLTILPWLLWAFIAVTAIWATKAHAIEQYEAISDDGVRIVLHDDACKLDAVVNLSRRITWQEKGERFEGCYGQHPSGFIIAYFADKKVALFPANVFKRIVSA